MSSVLLATKQIQYPTPIIDNEYATLWYHPDAKVIHHEFHQVLKGTVFKDVLSAGVKAFKQHGAGKWLSDDRRNGALHPEDSAWAIDVWTPQVLAAGWKYWALVMPDKALGKLSMKRYVNMYADLGVAVEIVETPEEGMSWLKSQK